MLPFKVLKNFFNSETKQDDQLLVKGFYSYEEAEKFVDEQDDPDQFDIESSFSSEDEFHFDDEEDHMSEEEMLFDDDYGNYEH